MQRKQISKSAFEGLLELQKLDESARAAVQPSDKVVRKRKKADREREVTCTSDLAALMGMASPTTALGVAGGGIKSADGKMAYDFERGEYVADHQSMSVAFKHAYALYELFNSLGRRSGAALSTYTMSHFAKPVRVIGYLWARGDVPADTLDQMPWREPFLKEWAAGFRSATADRASKKLDELYGDAPGINLTGPYVLLRRPLDPKI